MAGYYIPSSFAANYVNNKKNDDGTYTYDKAINSVGIDAQRNLQQLNKQYNVTINSAYASNLLANGGLRSSALGSGYKQAYIEKLQGATTEEIAQVGLSVADTKQSIFQSLGQDLSQINAIQQQEVNNIGRMASSLEQYYGYLQTLTSPTSYAADQQLKVGSEFSFEDNYDKLLNPAINNKGVLGKYVDTSNNAGLAYEDWLRQNSGNSADDTAWLDWAYSSGMNQYRDFTKNGVNRIFTPPAKVAPNLPTPTKPFTPGDNSVWDILRNFMKNYGIKGGS